MNLRSLKDDVLLEKIKSLVQNERDMTLQVLQHLREVERRSLFAVLSYSTLFEYAVKELKYSESSAQRRISSMRLLKELPELEQKIESGALPLSTLSQAQSFFRQEKTPIAEKREILIVLENKSSRDVEKELVTRSSEPSNLIREKIRPVSATHTELTFLVEEELLSQIEELKSLLSHKMPRASLKDLMAFAVREALKKLRYKEPKDTSAEGRIERGHKVGVEEKIPRDQQPWAEMPASELKSTPGVESASRGSRYIPVEVKRQVWRRDQGQCSFRCNGRRCSSKTTLEFDHVKPFACGGTATVGNLRLRCRAHNQLAAIRVFGEQKMGKFLGRLG